MPNFDYTLYDTINFGTTANTDHSAFTAQQGSSAGGNKQLTNMRGNGALPSSESFEVKHIGFTVNDIITEDDMQGLFYGSVLTLTVNQVQVLQEPLANFSYRNAFGGVIAQTTAADFVGFGLSGEGRTLSIPIMLKGGVQFSFVVTQGLALDNASEAMFVQMRGILSTS